MYLDKKEKKRKLSSLKINIKILFVQNLTFLGICYMYISTYRNEPITNIITKTLVLLFSVQYFLNL